MPTEPTTINIPEFPTLPRAARLLGISMTTLGAAVARGEIATYRIGHRWRRGQ